MIDPWHITYDPIVNADTVEGVARAMRALLLELEAADGWSLLKDGPTRIEERPCTVGSPDLGTREDRLYRVERTMPYTVDAIADMVFAPERGGEWDPTEVGFDHIASYGEWGDILRFRNRPVWPMAVRTSTWIYSPDTLDDGGRMLAAGAVLHEDSPITPPRLIHPFFGWILRPTDGGTIARVITTLPDGLGPRWLYKLITPAGWPRVYDMVERGAAKTPPR